MRAVVALLLVAACDDAPPIAGTVDAAIDAAPPDADPCGTRVGQRAKTQRMITAGGLARTYTVYLPAGADPATPMPLLFVMHGYTMSGDWMYRITDAAAFAEREQVAVALPDGQGGPDSNVAPWNVGQGVCPSFLGAPPVAPGDDFAFLDAMKADISKDQCLDRDHVYMTGFSMGGYFAHHAGCNRSDLRAVAPASGGAHDLAGCLEPHKPIIIFHGAADPLIPPGCTDPLAPPVVDVVPSATAWAIHNGCSSTVTVPTSVTNGTCYAFAGCPADAQVTYCTFAGMGHCWAGGAASAGAYSCPAYEPSLDLAWQFFTRHAWN